MKFQLGPPLCEKRSIHQPNINVSSLSNCDSEFKYIKRYLFCNEQKMRVDKFIFEHIRDINRKILLAIADLNSFQKEKYNEGI